MSANNTKYKGTIDQSIEQGEIALKAEWGRAYDQNVKFARKHLLNTAANSWQPRWKPAD
jgi:hypothetical protein